MEYMGLPWLPDRYHTTSDMCASFHSPALMLQGKLTESPSIDWYSLIPAGKKRKKRKEKADKSIIRFVGKKYMRKRK